MKHLIDRLEIAQGNNNADELIPEAIAMLRQQQAEIEALEILVDELAGYKASYENNIRMEDGYGLN